MHVYHTFWYIPSLHWKRHEISSSDDLWRATNHKTIKKWVRFLAIQPQENSFNYSEIFLVIASMVVATTPNYWMENKIDSSCQSPGKTDNKNLQRVLQQHCWTCPATYQVVAGRLKLLQKKEGCSTFCNKICTCCVFYRTCHGELVCSNCSNSRVWCNSRVV